MKYGMKPEDYDDMLKRQNGLCWICKTNAPGHKHNYFSIDHSHETGQIRGLLCNACNMGLGYFRDNTSKLESAIKYLDYFNTQQRDS